MPLKTHVSFLSCNKGLLKGLALSVHRALRRDEVALELRMDQHVTRFAEASSALSSASAAASAALTGAAAEAAALRAAAAAAQEAAALARAQAAADAAARRDAALSLAQLRAALEEELWRVSARLHDKARCVSRARPAACARARPAHHCRRRLDPPLTSLLAPRPPRSPPPFSQPRDRE
jgi:hypothetical protein